MTREEALNCIFVAHNIRTVVEHKPYLVDALWLLRTDVQKYINKIFDDNEAELKAKENELGRVRTENRKYKEHITLKHLNEPIVFCANCSEKVIKLREQQ